VERPTAQTAVILFSQVLLQQAAAVAAIGVEPLREIVVVQAVAALQQEQADQLLLLSKEIQAVTVAQAFQHKAQAVAAVQVEQAAAVVQVLAVQVEMVQHHQLAVLL
jgi:hypothetical protein